LIYVDSGGGHRAAARAIVAAAEEQQRLWNLCLHGVQQLLDPIDFIRHWTGIPFEEIYNILLRRGWTRGSHQLLQAAHLLIRLTHEQQVRVLEQHWRRHPVDMVVSLIPHYNRALCQAAARACPGRPFVTIMTDIADYPPHFWIENQDQYVVCGSERARQQARSLGLPESRVLRMSGMILHPRFHKHAALTTEECEHGRRQLGLHPGIPTGLVLFGGIGSHDTVRVVRSLNRPGAGLQLIVLCGRHRESFTSLHNMIPNIPMHIEGFTREVPYFMSLADFFIGKPGPGSITEALAMGLPVVVECNSRTMVHERYNAQWLLDHQAGLVVTNFDQLGDAVHELLKPERYSVFKAHAAAVRNTAVYEAVEWLGEILEKHNSPRSEPQLLASKR